MTPEIENEIAIVSNIGKLMETISDIGFQNYFSEIFFGSKHGYAISVDSLKNKDTKIEFDGAFNKDYDPRVRSWYIEASKKDGLIFTDVYFGTNGYRVTCAVPYHDSEGVAGVVGIGNALETLDTLYLSSEFADSRLEFILNDKAKIVMVSHEKNVLTAGTKDISQSEEETLVNVAKRMTAGESGIADVVIGGEDYYLAFAPIEMTKRSFGIIVKKQVERKSSEEVSKNLLVQMKDFKNDLSKNFLMLTFVSVFILVLILIILLS